MLSFLWLIPRDAKTTKPLKNLGLFCAHGANCLIFLTAISLWDIQETLSPLICLVTQETSRFKDITKDHGKCDLDEPPITKDEDAVIRWDMSATITFGNRMYVGICWERIQPPKVESMRVMMMCHSLLATLFRMGTEWYHMGMGPDRYPPAIQLSYGKWWI